MGDRRASIKYPLFWISMLALTLSHYFKSGHTFSFIWYSMLTIDGLEFILHVLNKNFDIMNSMESKGKGWFLKLKICRT